MMPAWFTLSRLLVRNDPGSCGGVLAGVRLGLSGASGASSWSQRRSLKSLVIASPQVPEQEEPINRRGDGKHAE